MVPAGCQIRQRHGERGVGTRAAAHVGQQFSGREVDVELVAAAVGVAGDGCVVTEACRCPAVALCPEGQGYHWRLHFGAVGNFDVVVDPVEGICPIRVAIAVCRRHRSEERAVASVAAEVSGIPVELHRHVVDLNIVNDGKKFK